MLFRSQQGYGVSARFRMIPLLSRIVLIVVMHRTHTLTIRNVGPALLVTSSCVGLIVLTWTARRTGIHVYPGRSQRSHLKTAALYSLGITGLSTQNDGDKAVLPKFHKTDAGLYGAAYRVVQFGLVPISSLLSSSLTTFMDHDEEAEGQHVRRTIRFTVVACAYSIVFGIFVYFAAPLITKTSFFDEFKGAASIIRWLAPFVFARAIVMFAINGLLGLGRTTARTAVLLGGAGLSLILYLTLIPRYSWKGAVAATLISEVAVGATAWFLLIRYQRLHDVGVRQAAQMVDKIRENDVTLSRSEPAI